MARPRVGAGPLRSPVASTVWALAALLIVAAASPPFVAACSCITPTLLASYYRKGVDSVVIATPQRLVSDTPERRTYGLLGGPFPTNTTVYKGCPRKLERFSSPGSITSCSMEFELGVPVLLFLYADRSVGPCDYTVPASALTPGDVAFLTRRSGCGSCVADNEVNCLVAPCQVSKPCGPDAAKCVDNYCGGCYAEWFKADGTPLVCSPGGEWGGWYPEA